MNELFDINNKIEPVLSKIDKVDTLDVPQSNQSLKTDFLQYNNLKQTYSTSQKVSLCGSIWQFVFPCLKKVDTTTQRTIFINEPQYNSTSATNEVANHKYNFITFIPLVLYNQFKFFGNQFYLVMTITQFIDVLKVGFLFSYFSPLLMVLVVTMVKELYDDIQRYRQDARTNNEEFILIELDKSTGKIIRNTIKSMDIKPGNLIEIKENQRIPADMILLKAYAEGKDGEEGGDVFIRTDQLDGETDWKLRKTPGMTQKKEPNEILEMKYSFITAGAPSKQIYEFNGILSMFDSNNNVIKEPLGLENTLWASTILASKKVIGIVVYTGPETRAQMNSSQPKMKFGVLDLEVNWLNKVLFVIMVILALVITIIKGFKNSNVFQVMIVFFRFIVLFCGIIPISLRVNLDISKTFFAFQINRDKHIKDTIVRNSTIPEELGRISYVFTDKTGTLTKNEMVFKKIAMETDQFGEDSFNDLNSILQDECAVADAPLVDMIKVVDNDERVSADNRGDSIINTEALQKKVKKRVRRNRNKIIRETIEAMALCNNVTPIKDENDPDKITYQASSPDEVALVNFAVKLKMRLYARNDREIKIKNASDTLEEYDVLANFPFSSDTKRMGILLKNRKHGHIIFYLKGAENVIERFVKEEYKGYIRENAENLACLGLRTLVLTQKIVSQSFYDEWLERYKEAQTSMENRKENIQKVISELENDMDFLCVTGVEDLLQDDVEQTIENLRNAGMRIWMLTGDKIETATCISISAGIKGKNQKIFYIRSDIMKEYSLEKKLKEIEKGLDKYKQLESNSHILIIDGEILELCLNNMERHFFESAMLAPSVVCCRCSPTQKSKIVKRIKNYTDKRTAAIGDGGNDVAMIQEADVGIGIVGKEGLQASLASDFSILKFNYLNDLLLWWGRLAYKNTSTMSNFVVHRGMIISLIQFIFSLMFYCNAVALYNGMLILGYSTIYTTFPSISVLLDNDTDRTNVVKFPRLYKRLLLGRELNTKAFLWWFLKSIYQSAIIMIGSIYLFSDNIFLKIVTVTFTELIFAELLNVYVEIKKFHKFMIFSLVGTLFTYLLTILLFDYILDVYFIFTLSTFIRILGIALASWVPFYIINWIRVKLYPEAHEKLNEVKKNEV